MFCSSLPPVVCRRARVLYTICSVRLYLQLFVRGLMSYIRYVLFVFTFSCLQEGSCLIYVMFGSSLPPVVCRRAHVLFTLCSVRLYLQLLVGGLVSYLRYALFVFNSSCLQEGSCLIYVMFGLSLPPVVCRRAHVLFTLCSVRLYLQLFVRGVMSYIRYVLFVFTSSCLQESSSLIYDMFGSSLPPVVCKRTLSYIRYVRLYLQLFVGGIMSYIRYVLFVFTFSCLQEGSCLIYVMFCSSLPPVVCRRAHVLFTLCSVRLYLQLFVERAHVLFTLCSVRLYLQLFVRGLMSYLRYVLFVFTFSCLQEGSGLIYVMFCSSLPPVACRRGHVLYTLCFVRLYPQLFVGGLMSYLRTSSYERASVRLYLQLFVGGLMSYLPYVLFIFTSSCLQEGSCLIYVIFCSSLPPVVFRRAHVLFTLCSVHLYLQLLVGGLVSYLRYALFVFNSSCLQEGSCLIYGIFCSSLPPVACRRARVLFTLCSVRL